MNTVDSLNKFGKALCGDAYVPSIGRTDAETIDDIATQLAKDGPPSSSRRIFDISEIDSSPYEVTIEAGLSLSDLGTCIFCFRKPGKVVDMEEMFETPVLVVPDESASRVFVFFAQALRTPIITGLFYYPATGRITS